MGWVAGTVQRNSCHDPAEISKPAHSITAELARSGPPATLARMVYGSEITIETEGFSDIHDITGAVDEVIGE